MIVRRIWERSKLAPLFLVMVPAHSDSAGCRGTASQIHFAAIFKEDAYARSET